MNAPESVNLLDRFILKNLQITQLEARLEQTAKEAGKQEGKVELNLTPRTVKADAGDNLPAYQVGAQLVCDGGGAQGPGPRFTARVGFETIYQQVGGAPVDLAQFTAHHASLTRQLYPLLAQELRTLLLRLGLEKVHLPHDLAARAKPVEGKSIQLSGALH